MSFKISSSSWTKWRISNLPTPTCSLLIQVGFWRERPPDPSSQKTEETNTTETGKPEPQKQKRKLSYKDQRELDALPEKIEALETEQEALQQQISEADFYKQDQDKIVEVMNRIETVQQELEQAYQRWEELE